DNKEDENKYAENAITNLLSELSKLGSSKQNIEICLVGGANVLKNENDTVANNLILYIFETIKQKKLIVKETSLGGYERRSATLNLSSGLVNFTVGDSIEKKLWEFSGEKNKDDNQ
ncbi:hypothetical protein, partial [Lentimicrobium sp. S6]|uniref:hypothetical protein n=1 Tax=Lentimicrobium sp. S6 TaxID=2735872 RepID=UPI001557407D